MLFASDILTLAEIYAGALNVPLTTVSARVFDDSKKLSAIKERDADLTTRRAAAAVEWFSDHWPEVDWPKGIARPSPRGAAA